VPEVVSWAKLFLGNADCRLARLRYTLFGVGDRKMEILARLIIVAFCLSSTALFAQGNKTSKEVLTEARRLYYSLSSQGVSGFHCDATLNWNVFAKRWLEARNSEIEHRWGVLVPPYPTEGLLGPPFQVSVNKDADVSVYPNPDWRAPSEMDSAIVSMLLNTGVDSIVGEFVDDWRVLTGGLIPEDDFLYRWQERHGLYRWSLKGNLGSLKSEFAVTMDKTYVIQELRVFQPISYVQEPQFIKTDNGLLLLNGYHKVVRPRHNVIEETVQITYQDVEGLQLPSTVKEMVKQKGMADTPVEINFSHCKLVKESSSSTTKP